ncbi:MAG: hypothetical protein HWQ41_20030 [Nostoc sp. NOS(2021)]|uniref:hypothetical protein n=1 Tax=Nostoc sp. NOS(2021) TaxID=2815407 RepID=UPI0025E59F6F|nr:hypothetical protein [Nostoc sp. NOS(2021)]MBN3897476.1 hypothetical protein [Nostoc sp. NOS(2021)]
MKFPINLSGGLLLALSIAVPSVFISTAAKAQSVVNKTPLEVNRVQTPIKFAPNVINKVDVLRPGRLTGKDTFQEAAFKNSFREKGKLNNPLNVLTQPAAPTSAVNTFRTLNKVR